MDLTGKPQRLGIILCSIKNKKPPESPKGILPGKTRLGPETGSKRCALELLKNRSGYGSKMNTALMEILTYNNPRGNQRCNVYITPGSHMHLKIIQDSGMGVSNWL